MTQNADYTLPVLQTLVILPPEYSLAALPELRLYDGHQAVRLTTNVKDMSMMQ